MRGAERSAELFARAERVIPGGVNSPVRAFRAVGGTPRFMIAGSGALLYDADSREYVDLVCSWGPMILGHAHPAVVGHLVRELAEPRVAGGVRGEDVLLDPGAAPALGRGAQHRLRDARPAAHHPEAVAHGDERGVVAGRIDLQDALVRRVGAPGRAKRAEQPALDARHVGGLQADRRPELVVGVRVLVGPDAVWLGGRQVPRRGRGNRVVEGRRSPAAWLRRGSRPTRVVPQRVALPSSVGSRAY